MLPLPHDTLKPCRYIRYMDRIVIFVFGAPVYLTTAFSDGSTPAEHFARRLTELSGIGDFDSTPFAVGGKSE